MVNREVATPIPIEGAQGYTQHKSEEYGPGEFARLNNCEIIDGRIRSRRNINDATLEPPIGSSLYKKAVGHFDEWEVYTNHTASVDRTRVMSARQYAYNTTSGEELEMWNPALAWVSPNRSFIRHIFKYNRRIYWLMQDNFGKDSGRISFYFLHVGESLNDLPNQYAYGDLTDSGVSISIDYNSPEYRYLRYAGSFLHKNRYWIVTQNTVYFSAPLEPTDFENGGTFGIRGSEINHVIPHDDTLYVLCDNAVYMISYKIDPNDTTDATIRKISDVGGMHGCIFRDTLYFINTEGVFMINNGRVGKFLDGDLDHGLNDYSHQELIPYREYLIVHKGYKREVGNASGGSGTRFGTRTNLWDRPSSMESPITVDQTGWIRAAGTRGVLSISSLQAHTGTRSLRIRRGTLPSWISMYSATGGPFNSSPVPDAERIRLSSGTYTMSMWVYVDSDRDGDVTVDLNVNSCRGTRRPGATSNHYLTSLKTMRTTVTRNSWQRVSVTFFVTSTASRDGIIFYNRYIHDAGEWTYTEAVYVDSILLERGNELNTFFNGDTQVAGSVHMWEGTAELSRSISVASVNPMAVEFSYYSRYDELAKGRKGYNTFFINMDNQSIHTITPTMRRGLLRVDDGDVQGPIQYSNRYTYPQFILDMLEAAIPEDWSEEEREDFLNGIGEPSKGSYYSIGEIVFNPNPDPYTGHPGLYLTKAYKGTFSSEMFSSISYLAPEYSDIPNDYLAARGTVEIFNIEDESYVFKNLEGNYLNIPDYEIELLDFSPTDREYIIKRFRNLELMAKLPDTRMELGILYEDQEEYQWRPLLGTAEVPLPRAHNAYRVGLNQKARAISIYLRITSTHSKSTDPVPEDNYTLLEIGDLNFLWTETKRGALRSTY